jgi:hypothetical protein
MRRIFSLPSLLAVLVLIIAACGGDADTPAPAHTPPPSPLPAEVGLPSPTPQELPQTAAAPAEQALLRVVNASRGLPPLSVYLGETQIVAALRPGGYQRTAQKVAAGEQVLRVAGSGEEAAPPRLEQAVSLSAGAAHVVVMAGGPGDLRLIVVEEDTSPLPAATARLRVVHALPDAGTLSVQDGQRTIISALSFGEASDAVTLAERGHDLSLLTADATLDEFDFYGMARHAYTVVLFPDPVADAEVGGVARVELRSRVEDEARVRLIHASPDLPSVDVTLGDTPLAADLAFRAASEWAVRRAATYQLRLLPAGDPDAAPILIKQITLRADEAVSLVLLGTQERLRLAAIAEDLSPTPVNAARLVFVNAAPGAVSIRVSTPSGPIPDLRPVPFAAASDPLLFHEGPAAFVIETGSLASPREVERILERAWQAGTVYHIIITDAPDALPLVLGTETGVGDTFLAADGVQPLQGSMPAASGWGPGRRAFAMRVVNALAGGPSIDFVADNAVIFESVLPGSATAYHDLGAPPSRLEVRQTGDAAVLFSEAVSLPSAPEGTYLTLYIFRDRDTVRFEVASDRALLAPDDYALVRVFHAAPDAPALRVVRVASPEPSPAPPAETPPATVPPAGGEEEPAGRVPDVLLDSTDFRLTVDPALVAAGTYELQIIERVSGREVGRVTVTLAPRTAYELILLPGEGGQGVLPALVTHRQ